MDSSVLGGIIDLESPQPHHHQRRQTTQLLNHPLLSETNPIGGAAFLFGKGKAIEPSEEEEEEAEEEEEDEPSHREGKKGNPSPWQRMKWSDEVVKLLIAVVACVGDDGGERGAEGGQKRKSGALLLQKKGKWKTVSKIMIGKGCQVSPQQCEDKFNDLNKRYKRLNDILGRGTSCRVVENPSLMDSMPNLPAKAKLGVQKILGSKHLFYKEMCAYHNGQAIIIPGCHDLDDHHHHLHNTSDEEPEEEEDDEAEEEEENHRDRDHREDVDEDEDRSLEGKSAWERREWVKKRTEELEVRRVEFDAEALELERQRFRWVRYCGNKDRELEKLRLDNERLSLENERRVLHLKHKEFELSHAIDRVQARDHIDLTTPQ